MNILARAIGLRFTEGRWARFKWGELSWTGFGLGLELSAFDDHWCLSIHPGFGSVYFRVWPSAGGRASDGGWLSYGFSWRWGREWAWGEGLHLNWGERCKIIHMPWGLVWRRTSLLMADGRSWVHEIHGFNVNHKAVPVEIPCNKEHFFFSRTLPRWSRVLPYKYMLRSGEVQERTATVTVSEMEWRPRALAWLAWPRKVRRTIDIEFSAEVGERTGSWKGGVTGCSYGLLPGEHAEECLRRMEGERKFT